MAIVGRKADPRLLDPAGVAQPAISRRHLLRGEPLTIPARFALQSELVANEKLPGPASADPRAAAVLENPLVGDYQNADGTAVVLTHSTQLSGQKMAAAMDHLIDGPAGVLV